MPHDAQQGPLQKRYNILTTDRQYFVDRACRGAELTIPSLFPKAATGTSELTNTSVQDLPTPFQSVGARGLNNLSSKLLLAILPPNSPFFRLMEDGLKQELENDAKLKQQLETALSKMERTVMKEIEKKRIRVTIFEALKQLLLTGNILLHIMPSGQMRSWRLDKYIVVRDPSGNPLEMIIREAVDPRSLTEALRILIGAKLGETTSDGKPKPVLLFTQILHTDAGWIVQQEANGVPLPGAATHPHDKLPYMALRFAKVDGENYGRGFIEEVLGDLLSLEGLTKAIVEGSAAAARLLVLVKPNSSTRQKDIEQAPNGAVRTGSSDDVTFMSMAKDGKTQDFRVAAVTAENIEKRLSLAFLLNTALQRKAERVTATEIREAAVELDDSLGGLFSILSVDLQLWLVSILMLVMQKTGKLPVLPADTIEPAIITGLDALGRRSDLDRIIEFVGILGNLGEQGLARLKMSGFIGRVATATGIELEGLIKTDDEFNAEQQALQQRQLMEQAMKSLGPNAIKAITDVFMQQQESR